MEMAIKRIYETASEGDGRRILVDRLWPRGVSKENARLDGWFKDIAPSPALRTWFGHREERFSEFAALYRAELEADPEKRAAVQQLRAMGETEKVTLLYGAKSAQINHAAVLMEYLFEQA